MSDHGRKRGVKDQIEEAVGETESAGGEAAGHHGPDNTGPPVPVPYRSLW